MSSMSLADPGDLGAHFEHDPLDGAPGRKITTRRTPRGHARQCRQNHAAEAVDQFVDLVLAHQFAPLLHQPQLQQLALDRDVGGVSLTARRLLPLAPQVPQGRQRALVEREAVTSPLDHAFGFELADVGPTAIQILRQC
jgi:hypothetical protein